MSEPITFRLPLSQVGRRLDPHFYKPSSLALFNRLAKTPYQTLKLSELILERCAGDWGIEEDAIDEDDQYSRCLVIRSTEFDETHNLRINGSRKKYRKIAQSKLSRMNIELGDILIEKSGGSPEQPVGRVAFVTSEVLAQGNLAYSNFVEKIKPSKHVIDPEYLFHYLRLIYSIGVTDRLQSQTNGIRNLMMSDYLKLPVSLPNKEQQQRISHFMREAYAQKANLEAKAAQLLASVDAVMYRHLGIAPLQSGDDAIEARIFKVPSSAVEGRLDPYANHPLLRQWFEKIKKSTYHAVPLSQVARFKREIVTEIPLDVSYLGLENISGLDGALIETVEKNEISSANVFAPNEILFPKLRPNLNKTHLASDHGVCSTEFHVLQALGVIPAYLLAYLRSNAVVSIFSQLVTGNTLPRLQTADIVKLPVISPPLDIQQQIADEIAELHSQAQSLRQQAKIVLEQAKQQVERMILGEDAVIKPYLITANDGKGSETKHAHST